MRTDFTLLMSNSTKSGKVSRLRKKRVKGLLWWQRVLRWLVVLFVLGISSVIITVCALWWRGMLPSRAELPRYKERIVDWLRRTDKGHMPQGEVVGIDISHYQSNIKWDEVCFYYDRNMRLYSKSNRHTKRKEVDFVYAKATQGGQMTDSFYKRNKAGAASRNIPFGAYHFFSTEYGATAQARHFIKTAQLQKGDMYPVLDVELYNHKIPNRDSIYQWLRVVEKYYGVKPIIYTNEHFYISYFWGRKQFSEYAFWIARYGGKEPSRYHIFWQSTENGKVAGVPHSTDINVFRGTKEDLNKYRL